MEHLLCDALELREPEAWVDPEVAEGAVETVEVLLEPRSAVILQGEARYKWTHAVPARKSDRVGEQVLKRSRRLSVTFRKVRLTAATP